MKSSLRILCVLSLSLIACTDKKEIAEEQRIFLTPETMCGTVQFTDGCGKEQDVLIRFGIALLHHMTYEDAAYTFDQVIKKDPDCFWGPWGKAMSFLHPMWPDAPSENEMDLGYVLSQRALSLAKKDKEKLYGAALAAFYEKSGKNKSERMADMQQGWAMATAQLPDDPEAALFNGLLRLALVSPADKTFAVQKEVGTMAEGLLAKYPDHPGAFHYAIHAYDVPPLAEKALFVARNYGKVAPEIPHALHMPSHIFTRLGYWQESIDWNARSCKAASRLPVENKTSSHYFHALDYMVYGLLQYGEDDEVKTLQHTMDTLSALPQPTPAAAYALAAIPSRIPLETHDWKAATQIADPDTSRFPWKKFPQYEALVYFAKGMGHARSGHADEAQLYIDKINSLQHNLGNSPQAKYWNDQMEAQKGCLAAWQELAKGNSAEALQRMTAAADLEDATQKNPVSPGSLLPARELLGDMLMELNQPREALAAYEKSLETNPNRYNTYYGAGMAAEKMKDVQKAKSYYAKLIALKGEAPSKRESLVHAHKIVDAS